MLLHSCKRQACWCTGRHGARHALAAQELGGMVASLTSVPVVPNVWFVSLKKFSLLVLFLVNRIHFTLYSLYYSCITIALTTDYLIPGQQCTPEMLNCSGCLHVLQGPQPVHLQSPHRSSSHSEQGIVKFFCSLVLLHGISHVHSILPGSRFGLWLEKLVSWLAAAGPPLQRRQRSTTSTQPRGAILLEFLYSVWLVHKTSPYPGTQVRRGSAPSRGCILYWRPY